MGEVKNVLVVGGGTAGWLTAAILASKFDSKKQDSIQVTLVESPDIPTIGVGEGTFPTMLETLKFIGVDESVFIRECQATFKQAIKFVDWLDTPQAGKQSHYYHLFNAPENASGIDLTSSWLQQSAKNKKHYAESVSVQAAICEAGLAPKHITTPAFQYIAKYAYHLDAGKMVELLTKHSVAKLGVKHLQGTVEQVLLHESGDIKSVVTQQQGEISADLFVDCTGFAGLLIDKTLQSAFEDKSDILFVDHAVAIQVPYQEKDEAIASHTISTAQEAGWIWDIGLQGRRGVGHVYSSRHTSHERAEKVIRNYIGSQAKDLEARKLKMRIGYRKQSWKNNCVAIGFTGGFMEPLEATAIAMIEASAFMLANHFPAETRAIKSAAHKFNQAFTYRWERIVDFIKLHYCLSRRRDSEFWRDNTDMQSVPESLLVLLERWKHFPPTADDFPNGFAMFNLNSYLYILYGMEFATQPVDDFVSNKQQQLIRDKFSSVEKQITFALKHLPKHRDLIRQIDKANFPVTN